MTWLTCEVNVLNDTLCFPIHEWFRAQLSPSSSGRLHSVPAAEVCPCSGASSAASATELFNEGRGIWGAPSIACTAACSRFFSTRVSVPPAKPVAARQHGRIELWPDIVMPMCKCGYGHTNLFDVLICQVLQVARQHRPASTAQPSEDPFAQMARFTSQTVTARTRQRF